MNGPLDRIDAKEFFESVSGPVKWHGDQGTCRCPLPTHGGPDRHLSFSVNAEKGVFMCHKEKISGGIKELAALVGKPSPFGPAIIPRVIEATEK